MFVGLILSGVVPVVHGLAIYGRQVLEDRMSLSWVAAHGAMYILGAVLCRERQHVHVKTADAEADCRPQVRWPERSCPGAFDIWGSSHQIFHVFVLAAATHLYGMAKAFDHHYSVMGSQCLAG